MPNIYLVCPINNLCAIAASPPLTLDKLHLLKNLLVIMRILFAALLSLCFIACSSTPIKKPALTSVDILEIKPRYMKAEAFIRIKEYLTGSEHLGDRVVIRSQPSSRDGYYFTLILSEELRDLPKGMTITGEFYSKNALDAETYEFQLPSKLPETNEVFVGLTGEDWPDASAVPAAWRFTIKDANGNTLASEKSFLWSI